MGKREFKEILEGLDHRRKSIDALRLLIEGGDHEMALVVASKLRGDIDSIIEELSLALGIEPPPPAEEVRPASETASVAPQAAPRPAPAPVIRRVPSRGYLGEDDGPGKLEHWIEAGIRFFWDAVVHPRQTYRRLSEHRGRLIFAVGIVLFLVMASRAYNAIFLSRYGLTGEYYLDTELQNLFAKRLDHTINFRWLRRPPIRNFRAEQFSIRWTGYVRVNEPDLYEFYTISDDGVRLWINDKQLIDNWNVHGATLDKGEVRLTPGYHKIRLEYFQGSGDMIIKLHWKRPSDHQKKVVPARYLYPEKPQE